MDTLPALSPVACRVLGSLLEKERTVPATYPLTMHAVVAACNQTTGRDPVMVVDEAAAGAAIDELRAAGLARLVHASHGARSIKYRQAAAEALELDDPRRAVLTMLLLRGPQTSGELRSRGERLYPFGSVAEVEATLAQLAERDAPLVVHRPRQPGQKERRWGHTLSGEQDKRDQPGDASPELPDGPQLPDELMPLAAFVGTWVGAGAGAYPTIEAFGYTEQIEIHPVPGKPLLAYRSATRASDDGRTLHGESGFWRVVGPGDDGATHVELVVAQGSGIVEAAEGVVDATGDATDVVLASTAVTGTSSAKSVTATERRYRVAGDTLTYDLDMAAVGQPLLPHLHATLTRHGL